MTRIAADPDNPVKRGKWPKEGDRVVLVTFSEGELAYLVSHMIANEMRIWRKGPIGAATVVRKIVVDAIAAHRRAHQAAILPTDVQPGWPDKKRLMAGR